jgi:hypothetical protein
MCNKKAEKRSVFLSRKIGDRLLNLVLSPILVMFPLAGIIGFREWAPVYTGDKIARMILIDIMYVMLFFILLNIIWCLFTPRWVESILKRFGGKMIKGALMLVIIWSIYFAYFYFYKKYSAA